MRLAVNLLDVVALTNDLPIQSLVWTSSARVGQVGRGQAFEVEFADRQGHTYEFVGLTPVQFIVLRYDPLNFQLTAERGPCLI